jgi:hypothetical protein
MKRTYSKLAAQPEYGKPSPRVRPDHRHMTTADRVRMSLLAAPGPRRGSTK